MMMQQHKFSKKEWNKYFVLMVNQLWHKVHPEWWEDQIKKRLKKVVVIAKRW